MIRLFALGFLFFGLGMIVGILLHDRWVSFKLMYDFHEWRIAKYYEWKDAGKTRIGRGEDLRPLFDQDEFSFRQFLYERQTDEKVD